MLLKRLIILPGACDCHDRGDNVERVAEGGDDERDCVVEDEPHALGSLLCTLIFFSLCMHGMLLRKLSSSFLQGIITL